MMSITFRARVMPCQSITVSVIIAADGINIKMATKKIRIVRPIYFQKYFIPPPAAWRKVILPVLL